MEQKKRQVFYSFHYLRDNWVASQIRNIGVVEGNKPVSDNDWEEVANKGDESIKRWIDSQMNMRSCLIVLVGAETANRKWVKYEIQRAWEKGMGVVGIYIHNFTRKDGRHDVQGTNPFSSFKFGDSSFDRIVECYNPNPFDAYNDVKEHLSELVERAIEIRNSYR